MKLGKIVNINTKILLLVFVIFSLSLFCLPTLAADDNETITLRVQSVYTGPLYEYDKLVLERISATTAGRIKFEVFQAGEIVSGGEILDAVSAGIVDAGTDFCSYWVGKNLAFDILATHTASGTLMDFLMWYYVGGGKDFYQETYGLYNIVYLPHYLMGPESGFRTNVPINNLEDFKGLKIRTSSYVGGRVLEALGASPAPLPISETYEGLQRGVIDGAEFSGPKNDWDQGFQEITKYVCTPSWHQPYGVTGVLINKDVWQSLPEDLKPMLTGAFEASMNRAAYEQLYMDAEATNKFLEAGVELCRLSDEDLDKIEEIKSKIQGEIASKNELYARILKSQVDFYKKFANYRKVIAPYYPSREIKFFPDL